MSSAHFFLGQNIREVKKIKQERWLTNSRYGFLLVALHLKKLKITLFLQKIIFLSPKQKNVPKTCCMTLDLPIFYVFHKKKHICVGPVFPWWLWMESPSNQMLQLLVNCLHFLWEIYSSVCLVGQLKGNL